MLDAASTGTLTLTGSHDYTGGTTLNGGTLLLGSGTALQSATGTFTLNGGTLASNVATTTLGGDLVLAGGQLNPNGSGAGSMALAAGRNFSMTGGTLNLQLGTAYDQILGGSGSTASLTGGTLALDVTGGGFSYDDDYQILGGFASITATGLSFTGYDDTTFQALLDPATGVLSFTAAIPEPGAAAAVLGILALALALRRRRPLPAG